LTGGEAKANPGHGWKITGAAEIGIRMIGSRP
jgi:hypothetical protein